MMTTPGAGGGTMMSSEQTVGPFIEQLKAVHPGSIHYGGMVWTYRGEINLDDWLGDGWQAGLQADPHPYCTRCGYPHEPGKCTR